MAELHDPHDAVQALFAQVPGSSDAVIDALERATRAVWTVACARLDPVIVAAIARRALDHAREKFAPLASIAIDAPAGISVAPLREHASTLRPLELRTGAAFFVDELATVLASCTGQLLEPALATALGAASAAPSAGEGEDPASAPRRLRALHAVSRALARFESIEHTVGALVAAVHAAAPLRTAALVLSRRDHPRLIVWHASAAGSAALHEARSHAMVAHAYLAGGAPTELPGLEIAHAPIAPSERSQPAVDGAAAARGRGIALPLLSARDTVFGLLRLEPAVAFAEVDLELLSTVTLLLASALEHNDEARPSLVDGAAEPSDQAQRELLSVISHDLRNPLSAILMSVVLLLRRHTSTNPPPANGASGGSGGDALRQLEVIKRSAERMNYLIQNLVDAVSLETGQMLIDPQPLDLAPVVDDSIRLLTSVANSKSVRLEAHIAQGTGAAMVDRERIVQTLANLLNACIRFAGRGGTITVALAPGAERGEVCVEIADNGPGIAADEVAHVFDRRWWAQRSSGLSTGLALSVAKGIVEAHGGRIWLTSTPGSGNAFHFTLPVARAEISGGIANGLPA